VGAVQGFCRVLAKTAPISNSTAINFLPDATSLDGQGAASKKWKSDKGVYVTNCGVAGETWRKMMGLDGGSGAADTDAAWQNGMTNVLLAWEGTNSITLGGRTPAQALSDAKDYITARRAVHPGWIVIVGTVPPRQAADQTTTNTLNANIDAYNVLIRQQYKSIGANGLFDVRAVGSKFNWVDANGNPDYSISTFEAHATEPNTIWASGETGAHVHFNSDGSAYIINNFVAPALRRLPRR
jgi:hypothetical protein